MAISSSTDRFNGLVASLAYKAPCIAASLTNITLAAEQTIVGVALVSGDRVLVAGQTDPIENGIYHVSTGAWQRTADFDGNRDVTGGTRIGIANAGVLSGEVFEVQGVVGRLPGSDPILFKIAGPYFLTATEIANGITQDQINGAYAPGDVLRYGALVDAITLIGGTDDAAAYNLAVQSGHPAHCSISGNSSIESAVVLFGVDGLAGGRMFYGHPQLRLERYTDNSAAPIFQVWGVQSYLKGNRMQVVSRTYDYDNGLVLLGAHPDAAATDPECVPTQHNVIDGLRLLGALKVGARGPGIYLHSIGRKRGDWLGINCYYNNLNDCAVLQFNKPFEFSTDANFNALSGCSSITYEQSALMFNAAYGNRVTNHRIESIQPTDVNQRYSVYYGVQNDEIGVETDTSSDYPIYGAWHNNCSGSAEIQFSPQTGILMRLVGNVVPSQGETYGRNVTEFTGTQGGGVGRDGQSDDGAVGFNSDVSTHAVTVKNRGQYRIKGFDFRSLDQGAGTYYLRRDSWAIITGREAGMLQSTNYNLFEVDDIGPDLSGLLIKLAFNGKADDVATMGEIVWAVKTDLTVHTVTKISDTTHSFGETAFVVPTPTITDGTLSTDYCKIRIAFNLNAYGVQLAFVSWKAELTHSNLQDFGLDWDSQLRLLSGFFPRTSSNVRFNAFGTLTDSQ